MKRIDSKTYDCAAGCPVEATLDLIDGKWKGVILYHLLDDTIRFNELKRRLSRITQRMLTRQLRELEPVVRMLWTWGNQYLATEAARAGAVSGAVSLSPRVRRSLPAGRA